MHIQHGVAADGLRHTQENFLNFYLETINLTPHPYNLVKIILHAVTSLKFVNHKSEG